MRRSLTWSRVWLVALALWYLLVPHVNFTVTDHTFRLVVYAAALVFGVLVASVIRALVPLAGWSRLTGWLLLGVATVMAVVTTAASLAVISDLAKIVVGIIAGMALGAAVERPGWLAPVALAVSVFDSWSVLESHGVTHTIVTKAPAVVPHLATGPDSRRKGWDATRRSTTRNCPRYSEPRQTTITYMAVGTP